MRIFFAALLALSAALMSSPLCAQPCPDKNINYWQGFPPGGEADQSARHQQVVLKKKCPLIETIVQYKPGASGGLMWSQMNSLPGDGLNIVGITLPHIVLQPMEGQVQYKTEDITPIYFFRYMPDAIVVPEASPIKTFQDLLRMAKEQPGKLTLAGSGSNSANHAAHEKLNLITGIQTIYVPYKGTGDLVYGGIGVPKSTPMEARRRLSELWSALNNDPEMKDLATKAGFDLIDINIDRVDQFMKERVQAYIPVARRMGLIK
ncbi:MAG: tripartite tricarboxylate transporter substrate binding protein [Betaproteobacteria bacterium]|nr:tripartite tricarboxylate transporter substrate binding protein [Betaproteobacteria bacterium]